MAETEGRKMTSNLIEGRFTGPDSPRAINREINRAMADADFMRELEGVRIRAYPALTLEEKRWQIARLKELVAKREEEITSSC
jgi:hypothetical protein